MESTRSTFLATAAAALFITALALAPATARACDHEAGACACGAACPDAKMCDHAAEHGCMGDGKNADAPACPHQEAGACPCGKGAAAGTAAPDAKAESGKTSGGAQQRAVIDPATGKLVEPSDEDAAREEPAAAAPSQHSGAAPTQVEQPDGGVMAPFPKDRASKAIATIDESGKPHAACEHGTE